jgi:hypothetical protein
MVQGKVWFEDDNRDSQAISVSTVPMRPDRRPENVDVEMAFEERLATLSAGNLSRHNQRMAMNHLVYKFTSPIGE